MNKTNRQRNTEHEAKELMRVRPKHKEWDHQALTAVINQWVRSSERSTS
jgi:hypothetical protein